MDESTHCNKLFSYTHGVYVTSKIPIWSFLGLRNMDSDFGQRVNKLTTTPDFLIFHIKSFSKSEKALLYLLTLAIPMQW